VANTDLWQLEVDDPDWLPEVITRLLAVGVPPTAVARAFDIEPQVVKDFQSDIRTDKYGAAELGEAVHFLMWQSFEDIVQIIKHAPMAKRMQMNMAFLAKASALVGSTTPDGIARMQSELADMQAETRGTPTEVADSIYVSTPLDAPPDDPEKRPEG
jgi:hypothetical protein